MATRKNSRLVTMELDLEAYKIKNKGLIEHLAKVQHEKAQVYKELNNITKQYWKLYDKFCYLERIAKNNMKESIDLLTNHEERLIKIFTEIKDISQEVSVRSIESPNVCGNRSRRSAQNSNNAGSDSLTEGIPNGVVTTRKNYNNDKGNTPNGNASINGNMSPTDNGADSSSQMAEVKVNIRKRRDPTGDDDRGGGGGTDQDLWDVDVHLTAAGGSNTNRTSDTREDDEGEEGEEEEEEEGEEEEEKLDTIQEEDEDVSYWTESSKRLKLMVTERKLGPPADEDSSMICQLDETAIDRTNASVVRESLSPVERRRRMADKHNRTSNVSASMDFDEAAAACTARRSPSTIAPEDSSLDLSSSSRLFMMKALSLRNLSDADLSRNDISFQTSTPFAEVSPRLRTRPKLESATPTSPCTVVDKEAAVSFESNSSTTMQPKRIFIETEEQTATTSGDSIDDSSGRSKSSAVTVKRGSSKKLPEVVVSREKKKTKLKSNNREEERKESDDKIKKGAVRKKDLKTNRKASNETERKQTQNKVDKRRTTKRKAKHVKSENETASESSCGNSSISESDAVEESAMDTDPSKDERAESTCTSSEDETLTEADNEQPKGGLKSSERLSEITVEDNNKIMQVVLDRAEIERYSTTKVPVPVPIETKTGQLNAMETSDISSDGKEASEQPASAASKKVKRRNQPRMEMKKDSPRPTRAAKPTKPLCEPNLMKKMRRSK